VSRDLKHVRIDNDFSLIALHYGCLATKTINSTEET
jgi:hypothetical protein